VVWSVISSSIWSLFSSSIWSLFSFVQKFLTAKP